MEPTKESIQRHWICELAEKDKLRYSAASTNIDVWPQKLEDRIKGAVQPYHTVITSRQIPAEWVTKLRPLNKQEQDALSNEELELRAEQVSLQKNWAKNAIMICALIVANMSESSKDQIEKTMKTEFAAAFRTDNVVELLAICDRSHSARDKTSMAIERENTEKSFIEFTYDGSNTMEKHRDDYLKMLKAMKRHQIVKVPQDFNRKLGQSLVDHPSPEIRRLATEYVVKASATITTAADIVAAASDLKKLYDEAERNIVDITSIMCTYLAASKGKNGGGDSKANIPDVNTAIGKINKKLKNEPWHTNKHTKAFIEKKMKSTGLTYKEIQAELKCHNCGRIGHIRADCAKPADASADTTKDGSTKQRKQRPPKKKDEVFGASTDTAIPATEDLAAYDWDAEQDSDASSYPIILNDQRSQASDIDLSDAFLQDIDLSDAYIQAPIPSIIPTMRLHNDIASLVWDEQFSKRRDRAQERAYMRSMFYKAIGECPTPNCPAQERVIAHTGESQERTVEKTKERVLDKSSLQLSIQERTIPLPQREDQAKLSPRYDVLAATNFEDKHDHKQEDYIYDDSLSNIPLFRNKALLTDIRQLKRPLDVKGVGGAKITECGFHSFFGRVLIHPSLEYNLIPQQYWVTKYGYSIHMEPDRSKMTLKAVGKKDIVFHQHINGSKVFLRAHKSEFEERVVIKENKQRPNAIKESKAIAYTLSSNVTKALEDNARFYTPIQLERAAEASRLHTSLGHPSDRVLTEYVTSPSVINCKLTSSDIINMRAIDGPCDICGIGKPNRNKGTNTTYEGLDIHQAGQAMHCDVVYFNKAPYLMGVDHVSGYVHLTHLQSKSSAAIMSAFQIFQANLRAVHKIMQTVYTDAEATFGACKERLAQMGISLQMRIPGEHEVVAERAWRSIRERVRMCIASIAARGLNHPAQLDVYLLMNCVNQRNKVPNSRSGQLAPIEMINGTRVNHITDVGANYFDLIMVPAPASKDPGKAKQEIGLCLGHVGKAMPGAVYCLIDETVVQRRPLRCVQWSQLWREKVAIMCGDGGVSDIDIGETTSENQTSQRNNTEQQVRLADENETRLIDSMSEGLTETKPTHLDQHASEPEHTPSAIPPTTEAIPQSTATTTTVAPTLRRSERIRSQSQLLKGTTAEIPTLNTHVCVLGEQDDTCELMGFEDHNHSFAAHLPNNDEDAEYDTVRQEQMVFVATLQAALKTQYRQQAIDATKKELKSLLEHKTWRYLANVNERQPSTHTGIEPSACILKDKKDSRGQFLLFKSRFYNVGSQTKAENYGPFDKTSPTASHDTVMLMLAIASRYNLHIETSDVPTAYVKSSLPDGKRHVMRINRTVTSILIQVDPNAARYVQQDGTILVELLQALYGLPEAGRLWHELLTNILRAAGYKPMPGDSCIWKRIVKNGGKKQISFIGIVVDDLLHIFNCVAARDHLYDAMRRNGIPKLTVQSLTRENPVSFCGISIERIGERGLFVSQPGYLTMLVNEYHENDCTHPNPLPTNYYTRSLTDEQQAPLPGGMRKYLRVLNSAAWLTRTRIDIATAIAMLQTKQHAPRNVDWNDLQHLLGYLRGAGNLGILVDVKSLQPFTHIDVGFAVHDDRKSHTGLIITAGEGGPPIVWQSSKHSTHTKNTADAELIGVSDKIDSTLALEAKLEFFEVAYESPLIVFQDNTSAITMAYMGRPSTNSRRRYLDIRFFYFKEFLDKGRVKLVYLSTNSMLADPLASLRFGNAFVQFVRRVMHRV